MGNLSLVLGSSLAIILFLEFIVFRLMLGAPYGGYRHAFVNGIFKYQPKELAINNQGWRSAYQNYTLEKPPGKFRIAIIGDSYVSAWQVARDQSLAEQLERRLGTDVYEVYRFGIGGAPLSQYLHMFRREVIPYSPDLVIFILIHNDFDESYNIKLSRQAEAFMRLKIVDDQVVGETEPKYEPPWFMWIMRSAFYGYLVHERKFSIQAFKDFFNRRRLNERYEANIDISNIEKRAKYDSIATDYIFAKIKEEADTIGIPLLMAMDGARIRIYKGLPSKYDQGALRLNQMAKTLAEKYDIPFVDLHPVFEQDYKMNKMWFNSKDDYHWNEYGHAVVAETVERVMHFDSIMRH
jgi:lysophospholipase L1-like esterase